MRPPDAGTAPRGGGADQALNPSEPATESTPAVGQDRATRRYSDDDGRDFLIQALRGENTSDGAYELVALTRRLWRNGQLADPELIAALHVGDNRHLDDHRRWTT